MTERAAATRPPADARAGVCELLDGYLERMTAAGMSKHTVASTRLDLQQLSRFLGKQRVATVTLDDLRAFFQWLGRQQGNSASSVRRKTSTVKRFFKQQVSDGLLDEDPAEGLAYPARTTPTREGLTQQETAAILKAADTPIWRALILCLLDAGLKRDEVVALQPDDVELTPDATEAGRLRVRHSDASKKIRRRSLRLTKRLAAALSPVLLSAELAPRDSLFGLSARGVDFVVETCGRRAGVRPDQKITPQMLRDAFADRKVQAFSAAEEYLSDDPDALESARRLHDRILRRELGLSDHASIDRYRGRGGALDLDGAE